MKNNLKIFLDVLLGPFRSIMYFLTGHESYTVCPSPPKEEKKKNPYELVYWNADWSESKTRRNNKKYWEWEMKYNGFKPQNIRNGHNNKQ